jgi:hypothetical protein
MDITSQKQMYSDFLKLSKYSLIGVVIVLAVMALTLV